MKTFFARYLKFQNILRGESRRNPCILTLDASNSLKTGSNQKVHENRPQLFFNSTLETGLTLRKWSTGRQITGVGKKHLIIFHMESFDSLTSNSLKTGSNQKVHENGPQLFFNSTLETGLTLRKWSTRRPVKALTWQKFIVQLK